jgi:hypothetical protein
MEGEFEIKLPVCKKVMVRCLRVTRVVFWEIMYSVVVRGKVSENSISKSSIYSRLNKAQIKEIRNHKGQPL